MKKKFTPRVVQDVEKTVCSDLTGAESRVPIQWMITGVENSTTASWKCCKIVFVHNFEEILSKIASKSCWKLQKKPKITFGRKFSVEFAQKRRQNDFIAF